MNVLLIGPRGSGKSTVGRHLAEALSWRFIDLDDRVMEGFEESSVSAIWAAHGEAAWRDAEVTALESALGEDQHIIALGGGVPMIAAAQHRIEIDRSSGEALVIYLQCSPAELRSRLSNDPGDRPSLTKKSDGDPIAEIEVVLAQREPTYRAIADHVHIPHDETVEETTQRLMHWINEQIRAP